LHIALRLRQHWSTGVDIVGTPTLSAVLCTSESVARSEASGDTGALGHVIGGCLEGRQGSGVAILVASLEYVSGGRCGEGDGDGLSMGSRYVLGIVVDIESVVATTNLSRIATTWHRAACLRCRRSGAQFAATKAFVSVLKSNKWQVLADTKALTLFNGHVACHGSVRQNSWVCICNTAKSLPLTRWCL